MAGSSHDPLQSPAVASGAVSKPGGDTAGQDALHSAGVPQLVDGMLGGILTLTALNRYGDYICQSPDDLIMAPAIPPIPQCLWTAAEDMLQCATPLARLACW